MMVESNVGGFCECCKKKELIKSALFYIYPLCHFEMSLLTIEKSP